MICLGRLWWKRRLLVKLMETMNNKMAKEMIDRKVRQKWRVWMVSSHWKKSSVSLMQSLMKRAVANPKEVVSIPEKSVTKC